MKTIVAACFLVLCQSAIAGQSVASLVARCESEAYSVIGVQPDNRASIQYLEQKHELVRVCLVRNGLKFKSSQWSDYYSSLSESVYKQFGIWTEKPGSPKYVQYFDEAKRGIERQVHIEQMSYKFWEF